MKHLFLLLAIFFMSFSSPLVSDALTLVPGGENIAFELYPDGIIVTGSYDVSEGGASYNPARDSDIVKGDRITYIGDVKVSGLSSFTEQFYKYKTAGKCPITLIRNNRSITRELYLIRSGDTYKTGLYVKERILGVGTASFYDPATNRYGALAHEVYDNDTQSILDVRVGEAYLEEVESITKSKNGSVGSKNCDLTFENHLGSIEENTSFGIFGTYDEIPSSYEPVEVSSWQDVKLGKAYVRTCIHGSQVGTYEIEITALKKQESIDVKGISFTITDPELLSEAGGVYSGMSGSPILQEGKLVGAVTHVNVDSVRTGYAVYMEYMYQQSVALS